MAPQHDQLPLLLEVAADGSILRFRFCASQLCLDYNLSRSSNIDCSRSIGFVKSGNFWLLFLPCILVVLWLSPHGVGQPPQEITNSIGMKLILIKKGQFMMGSPENQPKRFSEEIAHEVTLTKDYYMGAFEVTQAQYREVMRSNPSYHQGKALAELLEKENIPPDQFDSDSLPVEWVTWNQATAFCKELSKLPKEKAMGREYRLPTEAEWEYACRAGTQTSFSFGDNWDLLKDYAWFEENSRGRPHPVGRKNPNPWGLFDMHGNVTEWCADHKDDYPTTSIVDPFPIFDDSTTGLERGGAFDDYWWYCRSATRSIGARTPDGRIESRGFRVIFTIHETVEPPAEKTSGQCDAP